MWVYKDPHRNWSESPMESDYVGGLLNFIHSQIRIVSSNSKTFDTDNHLEPDLVHKRMLAQS